MAFNDIALDFYLGILSVYFILFLFNSNTFKLKYKHMQVYKVYNQYIF